MQKREEEFKKKEEGYHARYEKFQEKIKELEEENEELRNRIDKDDDKVQVEYYRKECERMEDDLGRYRNRLPGEIWRRLRIHNVKVNESEYDDFCEELSNLL